MCLGEALHGPISFPSLCSPRPAVGKRETLGETISGMRIDADCAVNPDGQNSVNSFVISK